MSQETANQESFQGRYVLRHPWKGEVNCPQGERYRAELGERRAQGSGGRRCGSAEECSGTIRASFTISSSFPWGRGTSGEKCIPAV